MWNLYGKQYDLTEFAKKHPGGQEIIENTRGLSDCTALFESYHAFSDLSCILQSLAKYELPSSGIVERKTYDFSNYRELTSRIKMYYRDRTFIKASQSWQIWMGIIGTAYVFLLWGVFTSDYVFIQSVLALLSGVFEMSLLFNVLHDSSHYAVALNADANVAISQLANGWALWNHTIWFYHHVYYHHSFTGGQKYADVDLYNAFASFTTRQLEWIANFVYIVFPGQHTSQIIWYALNSVTNKIVFFNRDSLFIPAARVTDKSNQLGICVLFNNARKNYNKLSICAMCLKFGLFYSMGVSSTAVYLIGVNAAYYINILASHDLLKTRENYYNGRDWAKRQICNSGNFANDNALWTVLFGGINYQIEHHLFPNMCNHHYPEISHIVRKFCKEKGFPYSQQPTVIDAYRSIHYFTRSS